jgi:tRNA pseudouridine55 synthase
MQIVDSNFTDFDKFVKISNEEGILALINKPITWTSFDVVNKLRYASKVKKVGHAGTLDPLAEGLVLIAFGKATKKINDLILLKKRYIAEFKLGAITKSYDSEYEEEEIKSIDNIDYEKVNKTIKSNFIGTISQIPPIFSAKKVNGKRAYKLARNEKEIELQPVDVEIYKYDILNFNLPYINFDIECSKGTYIRALARDLGKELKCGAYMTKLNRTSIGQYSLEFALNIEEFINKINYDKSI